MPIEAREIIFSKVEVIESLCMYYNETNDPLPPGKVFDFVAAAEPIVHVAFSVAANDDAPPYPVLANSEILLASFLKYCEGKQVPLPRRSKKYVRLFADRIGMVVLMRDQSDRELLLDDDDDEEEVEIQQA